MDATGPSVRRLVVRLGVGGAVLVASSASASAHEVGRGGEHWGAASVALVLGLPVLAGLVGGAAVVRYRRVRGSAATDRGSSVAVGVLLVALGAAALLPGVTGHVWLSVAGGTVGAAAALRTGGGETGPRAGRENHAGLALGAVSAHRLLEGAVLGALYSAGAAVGLFGAVALAGHAALETAAVGGLYAAAPRRTRAVVAVVLVQASYVVGAAAGLVVAGAVPAPVRVLALAVAGGALLTVGASEAERSIAARGPASGG